jgi:hypothetical protein
LEDGHGLDYKSYYKGITSSVVVTVAAVAVVAGAVPVVADMDSLVYSIQKILFF